MMPFCVLTTEITLDDFCQLNIGTGIGHDSFLGEYVTTGMNPNLAGNTVICRMTRLGSNVTTIEHTKIYSNVIVGAGSLVLKDITEPGTYVGSPIRKIK